MADRRANAVGPLRLCCEPQALRIDLLYVGRFSLGYVAPSVADTVSVRVPYSAVRALMRDGDKLLLSIDPRVLRPYNRFALTRFGPEPLTQLMRAYRWRQLLRAASALMPWLAGAMAVLLGGRWFGWRLPLASVGGALVALLVLVLLARLTPQLAGLAGRPRLADTLAWEISRRMGLEPAETVPPPAVDLAALAAQGERRVAALSVLGARARWLALALLTGLLAVMGSIHVVQRFGELEEILLDVPPARVGWGSDVAALSQQTDPLLIPKHDPCVCARPASPIWSRGMAQLSFMVTPRKGGIAPFWIYAGRTYPITHPKAATPPPKRRKRHRKRKPRPARMLVEFELAVMNNSALALDTVSLVVTFARRDGAGRRSAVIERGLHWPKTLKPGGAVKWRIRAEGNEMRLDSANTAPLGEAGLLPAPADAFFAQRKARLRAVRLHAATMLAYLGDPRAAQALDELGPLGPREGAIVEQLRATFTAYPLCAQAEEGRVCVHNNSSSLTRAMAIRIRGEPTPRWTIADLFYPGKALSLEVAGAPPAAQLSAAPAP